MKRCSKAAAAKQKHSVLSTLRTAAARSRRPDAGRRSLDSRRPRLQCGAIGVCIGGIAPRATRARRNSCFAHWTMQTDPELAKLETYIMAAASTLGIGTMGFGGGVTSLVAR